MKQTDEGRRLALQIAAQLPEGIAEAREVLDASAALLENFLMRGPYEVWGRAELGAPQPNAAHATAWTLAALVILSPIACGLAGAVYCSACATFVFAAGVLALSLIFGSSYGIGFAVGAAFVRNLFVVPPVFEFSRPEPVEFVILVGLCSLALLAPLLARHAERLRRAAVIVAPCPAGDRVIAARLQG